MSTARAGSRTRLFNSSGQAEGHQTGRPRSVWESCPGARLPQSDPHGLRTAQSDKRHREDLAHFFLPPPSHPGERKFTGGLATGLWSLGSRNAHLKHQHKLNLGCEKELRSHPGQLSLLLTLVYKIGL